MGKLPSNNVGLMRCLVMTTLVGAQGIDQAA
jgi:hypothetical protein